MAISQFDIQPENESLANVMKNAPATNNQQWDIQPEQANGSLGQMLPSQGGIANAALQGVATSLGTGLKTLGNAVDGTTTQNIGNKINQLAKQYLPYQPSIANDLANNIGRFAPFLAAPEFGLRDLATSLFGKYAASSGAGALLSRAAIRGALPAEQGATYGLTQTPNNPMGGAESGALTGLTLAQGPAIATKLGGSIMDRLMMSAKPGIQGQISAGLQQTEEATPSNAYQIAAKNYEDLKNKENDAWSNAKSAAANLDTLKQTVPGAPTVNNASYIQAGKDLINQLKSQGSGQATLADKNKNAIDAVTNLITPPEYDDARNIINAGHSTNSFSDLVDHNQALNNIYRQSLNKSGLYSDPALLHAVGNMKGALKNTFNENMQLNNNAPEVQNFKNLWDQANYLTQQRNNIFEHTAMPGGQLGNTVFSKMIRNDTDPIDSSNFINQFLPSKTNQGIGKFSQLSHMLGDVDPNTGIITPKPELAKQYLTNAIYSNAGKTGDFKIAPTLNKYNSLSDMQKGYLHSPEEQQLFQALNAIQNKSSSGGLVKNLASALGPRIAAPVIGALGGAHVGAPGWGAFAGSLGAEALPHIQQAIASNPMIRDELIARATGAPSPLAQKIPQGVKDLYKKALASGVMRAAAIPSFVGGNQ